MGRTYRRRRVLVLEDEPREARAITRILEDEGYQVDTVFGGEEALGRLAADHYEPYDVLVLDLRMPGLNGLHVVTFVLHHRREMVPRILITSTASRRDHPEMVGTASIEIPWLVKPYKPEELIRQVREISLRVVSAAPTMRSFR